MWCVYILCVHDGEKLQWQTHCLAREERDVGHTSLDAHAQSMIACDELWTHSHAQLNVCCCTSSISFHIVACEFVNDISLSALVCVSGLNTPLNLSSYSLVLLNPRGHILSVHHNTGRRWREGGAQEWCFSELVHSDDNTMTGVNRNNGVSWVRPVIKKVI